MLGTHILCKGGVMIHWFGPLGRYVSVNNHAANCCLFFIVVSSVLYLNLHLFKVLRHGLMVHSLYM